MNKKKKQKLVLLLVLVLGISIGYAAIASTLKINGNTTVKGLNWSIYWDNVVPTTGSVTGANVVTTPTTTGTTTTTIDFAVILPEPGDFYEFEVDAVNAGTIDAMIADEGIITKAYSDANYTNEVTLPDVVRYTVTYQDGTAVEPNHLLAKKNGNTPTRERYKVRVEYRNDDEINPDDLDGANDREYYLRFEVEYVQADDNAINLHPAPVVNLYLTRFDGIYTYRGPGSQEYGSLNDEWDVFLRNDGTTLEICGVYGSGNEDIVCLASGNYENDFEDCTDNEPDYDGTGETCIKGYTKAKADEMLSKGASSCSISNYYGLSCSGPIVSSCGVVPSGNVGCYDYSDTGCDVLDNSVSYCDF